MVPYHRPHTLTMVHVNPNKQLRSIQLFSLTLAHQTQEQTQLHVSVRFLTNMYLFLTLHDTHTYTHGTSCVRFKQMKYVKNILTTLTKYLNYKGYFGSMKLEGCCLGCALGCLLLREGGAFTLV